MTQFYTYLWLRENGTPYYVGKGSGNRAFENNGHKVYRPEDKERIIVQTFESEEDALFVEKFIISLYGRKDNDTGILRNLTDGGDGGATFTGKKHTPESLEKMRLAQLGNKHSLGYKHTEEVKETLRLKRLGNKHPLGCKRSPETIEKMRIAARNRVYSTEECELRSIAAKKARRGRDSLGRFDSRSRLCLSQS